MSGLLFYVNKLLLECVVHRHLKAVRIWIYMYVMLAISVITYVDICIIYIQTQRRI